MGDHRFDQRANGWQKFETYPDWGASFVWFPARGSVVLAKRGKASILVVFVIVFVGSFRRRDIED
jgi:hypothetical protein